LFENSYPNLNFIDNKEGFDKIINPNYQFYKKLQEGIAEHLGYKNAKWIKPILNIKPKERPIKNKYVVINIHSTTQMKYWNHPDGKQVRGDSPYWNNLCRMLRKNNLTPIVVEKNQLYGVAPNFNGLPKKSVKRVGMPLEDVVNYIQHAEFFIGLSSGLAWIALGLGKKVAIIANFTNEDHEIPIDEYNYKRITNKSVCHGCWNNPKYDLQNIFDNKIAVWDECPEHKGTNRQFECHTSITPEHVFNKIEDWI
jgi:autotransporter strand-loop-strand O-heptosyltransferase